MSSFLPQTITAPALIALIDLVVVLLGFRLAGWKDPLHRRLGTWTLAIAAVGGAHLASDGAGAGFRMLAICAVLLHAMKVLTLAECDRSRARLTFLRWLGYAWASFGMRPAVHLERAAVLRTRPYWIGGVRGIAIGLACLLIAVAVRPDDAAWRLDAPPSIAPTLLLLLGISLVFHTGVFQLATAAWRAAGFRARLAFAQPLAARSLREFWSERWNLPFVEMTAQVIYRPLRRRLGHGRASLFAFAFSGLLHELAISLPPMDGWGSPLLYFAMHGGLMQAESWLERLGHGPSTWGRLAHLWVVSCLLLPLPLLFHAPFLTGLFPAGA